MAVLEGLLTIVPRQIWNGNIVELGDFGTLSMNIRSKGSDTLEEVKVHNIKRVLPRFTPAFKQVLSKTKFVKAS